MAEARVERRLAAILAADVAGYSRLMGVDEEGTLAALKAHRRELITPKIAEHCGRIVKTTRDGVRFGRKWHFSDVQLGLVILRYRGNSRHGAVRRIGRE